MNIKLKKVIRIITKLWNAIARDRTGKNINNNKVKINKKKNVRKKNRNFNLIFTVIIFPYFFTFIKKNSDKVCIQLSVN